MIVRTLAAATVLAVSLPLAGTAHAASCASLPRHGASPIVDNARVLDDALERTLASTLEAQRRQFGAAVVVLTVPTLGGQTVEAYAHDVFGCWGVGSRDRNDGVLIMLAMRERKVRIEVGAGLRDRFTDAEAAAVIDQMVPHLRSGDVQSALVTGGALVMAEVAQASIGVDAPQDLPGGVPGGDLPDSFPGGGSPVHLPGPPAWLPLAFVGALALGGFTLFRRLVGGVQNAAFSAGPWVSGRGRYGGSLGSSLPGFDSDASQPSSGGASGSWSGSSDSGSGSSSSGSSFGGGSSGGGGASGSW